MGAPELIALVLSGALLLYILSGGADFGGGMWDLLARGPRAAAQRRLIERAIAPVWEANHVWLIVAVVLLFTAFPPAYSALATRLHVPLVALLIGIVLRGSALVFRQYGGRAGAARWGTVFAVASSATPFFLGVVLGAVTSGAGGPDPALGHFTRGGHLLGSPQANSLDLLAWVAPLPIATGAAAIALCAYLAAVYLTVEARAHARGEEPGGEVDPALVDDFRKRAITAWLAVAVTSALTMAAAWTDAPRFASRLVGSPWSAPLAAAALAGAIAALAALARRRFRLARALAVLHTSALLASWGAAHAPYLLAPDLTVRSAAAPAVTLELLAPVLIGGAVLVLPALYFLLRVFKTRPSS